MVASVGGPAKLAPRAVLAASATMRLGWTSLWGWPAKAVAAVVLAGSLGTVAAMADPAETVAPSRKSEGAVTLAAGRTPPADLTATNDKVELTASRIAADPVPTAPPATPAAAPPHRPPPPAQRPNKDALTAKDAAVNDPDAAMAAALRAIARARRELAAQRPKAALTTLEDAAARYAPLDRERQRLTLEAACALGRTALAQNARHSLGEEGTACPEKTRSP